MNIFSEFFGLSHSSQALLSACHSKLRDSLSVDIVIPTLELAHIFNQMDVMNHCVKFALGHFDEVKTQEGYVNMDSELKYYLEDSMAKLSLHE